MAPTKLDSKGKQPAASKPLTELDTLIGSPPTATEEVDDDNDTYKAEVAALRAELNKVTTASQANTNMFN